MDLDEDYIKQESDSAPKIIKEEKVEVLDISQRIILPGSVTHSPNVIVLRRPDVGIRKKVTMSMPPPLTQIRKKTAPNKTFIKRSATSNNTDKANPRQTYERRRIMAQERTVDVMNRMANSLSTMARTLPLLTQEIAKVREEIQAVTSKMETK